MEKSIKKIFELVRENYALGYNFRELGRGSLTFFEDLEGELGEVRQVLKEGKKVYIEDELCDILWVYCNLLFNLDREGKIDLNNVFERTALKYSQRLAAIRQGVDWSDIKARQNVSLLEEQKRLDTEKS